MIPLGATITSVIKPRAISPLVSALLLTMIFLAGFALLYTMWQSYASRVSETQKQEIIKVQKELSLTANIEYAYVLVSDTSCILYIWYYCAPLNCNWTALYIDNALADKQPHINVTPIDGSLYLYNTTIDVSAISANLCEAISSKKMATIKLVVSFAEPGSPYYITKELTYTAPAVIK